MHHPDLNERLGLGERLSRGAATLHDAATRSQRVIDANSEFAAVAELGDGADSGPGISVGIGIVLHGWACRYRLLPDGRRQIVDILLPGDLVGLEQLFAPGPGDPVLALTDVTLGELDRGELAALCCDAEVTLHLLSQLIVEKRRLDHTLTMVGQMVADERIAALLVECHERLSARGSIKGASFSFPMTQQQIGDLLGVTVVHVNRVLKRMRNDGIVVLKHRLVIIRDMARLRSLASGGSTKQPIGSNAPPTAASLPDIAPVS